ncbi:Uncharacterised protein [Mycobacterium tuberculosis]|nr:Uncharacterised protein [Mycobacterium tuberculosis]
MRDPSGRLLRLLHTRSDSLHYLAHRVALLPVGFTPLDPPELAGHLAAVAGRITRAAGGLPH